MMHRHTLIQFMHNYNVNCLFRTPISIWKHMDFSASTHYISFYVSHFRWRCQCNCMKISCVCHIDFSLSHYSHYSHFIAIRLVHFELFPWLNNAIVFETICTYCFYLISDHYLDIEIKFNAALLVMLVCVCVQHSNAIFPSLMTPNRQRVKTQQSVGLILLFIEDNNRLIPSIAITIIPQRSSMSTLTI